MVKLTATKTRTKRQGEQRRNEFFEVMPGTFSQSYGFPAYKSEPDDLAEVQQISDEDLARRKMVRQGLLLLGLLLMQVILFAALIVSTVNLN